VRRLQLLELAHERIEGGIADLWSVVNVVELFVATNVPTKLFDVIGWRHE
jgi:hypothetical protein